MDEALDVPKTWKQNSKSLRVNLAPENAGELLEWRMSFIAANVYERNAWIPDKNPAPIATVLMALSSLRTVVDHRLLQLKKQPPLNKENNRASPKLQL